MPPSNDHDSLARETVVLIRELTDDVARLRQDVTRATAPLFPRILGIERAHEQDRKEREQRQHALDERLSRQDRELKAQSDILTTINVRGYRRLQIEIAILAGVLFVAALLLYVFR